MTLEMEGTNLDDLKAQAEALKAEGWEVVAWGMERDVISSSYGAWRQDEAVGANFRVILRREEVVPVEEGA